MSGGRPCRINSLCGRCIEVFFFSADANSRAYGPPIQSGWTSSHLSLMPAQGALDYLVLQAIKRPWEAVGSDQRGVGISLYGPSDDAVRQCPYVRAREAELGSPEAALGLPPLDT